MRYAVNFGDSKIVHEVGIEALLKISAYDFSYKKIPLRIFWCNTCTLMDMKLKTLDHWILDNEHKIDRFL